MVRVRRCPASASSRAASASSRAATSAASTAFSAVTSWTRATIPTTSPLSSRKGTFAERNVRARSPRPTTFSTPKMGSPEAMIRWSISW